MRCDGKNIVMSYHYHEHYCMSGDGFGVIITRIPNAVVMYFVCVYKLNLEKGKLEYKIFINVSIVEEYYNYVKTML